MPHLGRRRVLRNLSVVTTGALGWLISPIRVIGQRVIQCSTASSKTIGVATASLVGGVASHIVSAQTTPSGMSLGFLMEKVLQIKGNFSLFDTLFKVRNLPGGTSLAKRLQGLNAIYSFAPELRLHPDDRYRPASVPWFLNFVHMRRHRNFWPDVQILGPGQVNVRSLVSQSDDGQHSGEGTSTTSFFLEIVINEDEARRGKLSEAECYVYFREAPANNGWDIQYWFFYPYNGDITTGADIEHEGDFEHVTVRTTEDLKSIKKVFYASHATESEWRNPGNFSTTAGSHPIAYSAYHSHATYATDGTHTRTALGIFYVPDDKTSNSGPRWQTWNDLRLIGSRGNPRQGQEWIRYTGHWGQIGSSFGRLIRMYFLSGPFGPAFQAWWDDDDKGNTPS